MEAFSDGVIAIIITVMVLELKVPHGSALARAVGRDRKGIFSFIANLTGALIANFLPVAAIAIYVLVAVVWIIPDRRVERAAAEDP